MSEIVKVEDFKKELMTNYYKTLVNFMKSEDNAKRFMSAVVYSVQKTPKLLECDRESLMTAFMTCADF
jgi:recombinational DNA repair protein RecT